MGLVIVVIVGLSAEAFAERVAPVASIAVHVQGEGWQRSAMQTTLRRDVATDRRWRVVQGNADVVLMLRLANDGLHYEVSIPSARVSRVSSGFMGTTGKDRRQLRNDVRNVLAPLLLPGGAVERVVRIKLPLAGELTIDGATVAANTSGVMLALAAVALFLLVPFLLSALLLGGLGRSHLSRLRSVRMTALIWAALAAVALSTAADVWPTSRWPIYIPAGIVWGWFVAALAQMTFPPFRGLERIEHSDVFRLLRAWSFVALQRLVTGAVLYGPFLLGTWWTCAALNVAPHITIGIVVPTAGLTVRFCFLSLVETLAVSLDARLVSGNADESNPWAIAVRGYFDGYLTRANATFPDELLARVHFLPGKGNGIQLFGGGLTPSRIVIGTDVLEFALAPYDRPHDYAAEREHRLLWNEWTTGLVIPVDANSPRASHQDREPRHELDGGEIEHQRLGQPRTLAGYVEPSAVDHRVNFRPSEDPVWLEWEPGEDHDGTDPNDKDFLFGALVRELGLVERRDDHMLTISLALSLWLQARNARFTRAWRWLTRPYRLLLLRYPMLLADAYTTLNHGKNHLAQHLAWCAWSQPDQLSARAYPAELERQTKQIFTELAQQQDRPAGDNMARRRLVWLSWFSHTRLRSRRVTISRRIAYAAVGIAVVAGVALGVQRAIDYHPTYVKRLEAQDKANKSTGKTHGEEIQKNNRR